MTRVLAFIVLLLAAPSVALGGGPLVITTNGVPVGWNTTTPVPYYTDRGGLGSLSNTDAVALVKTLFARWADVPTATIAFSRAGATTVDINASNFGPFLGPFGGATSRTGQNVIVFDADGAIFDTLFGVGTQVLGFADPTFFSDGASTVALGDPVPSSAKIVEGLAFLNGKFIDGVDDPGSGNFEVPLATFEAVFVHEFGHFSGLDHTQIHGLNHPAESDLSGPTQPVETMFPFIFDEGQATPERDDVVALSLLYPTATFAASTGRITGRVLASDGTPLSGINVIARNLANDSDAVSYVSGMTLTAAGAFSLSGLTPGASYRVEVQEVDAFNSGGSRVGPFSPPVILPGPPEFYNGAAESADPALDDPSAFTPLSTAAGATLSGIDIVLNSQPFQVQNVAVPGDSQLTDFAIGDFDRDGIVDFVATQFGFSPGNLIRFYRGLSGGAFAAPVTVASFDSNARVVAGQFNAGVDTFLDIAVASDTLNEARVYFGNGAGGFGPPTTLVKRPDLPYFSLSDFARGDLNGDAFPDLVTLVQEPDGGVTAYGLLGSAAGSFTVVATRLAANSGFPLHSLTVAQVAGSTAGDVIGIASFSPPALGLLIGDGTGHFTATPIPLTSISFTIGDSYFGKNLAVGDFDQNGTLDVALADLHPVEGPPNFTRSFIDLLRGDGHGGFTLSARYAVPETSQSSVVAADFDGDGHLDIASTGAWFGPGSPGAKVTIAFGNGAGGIEALETIWGLAELPQVMVAADLDGDQQSDLLVSNCASDAFGLSSPHTYSVLLNQALPADLIISSLSAPTSAGAGSTITVTETTKNQGQGGTGVNSTTKFYLSSNSTLDTGDVLLGSRAVPALASTATNSGSTSVTFPSGTAPGTWYLIAKADANNSIPETSESNNTKTTTIKIGPDLIISSLSAPTPTGAGSTITVTETTKNQGGGSTGVGSITKFYLSSNSTLDTGDVLLGSRAVPVLASTATNSGSTSVTLPSGTAPGTWYLIAKADANSSIPETSESNNTKTTTIKIGPDLIISSLSALTSARAGSTITVTETTMNQGGGGTGVSSTTKFYLSTNSTLDTGDVLVGSRTVPALASTATNSGSTSVTLPSGTAPGTWYLIAKADANTSIPETSESNNTKSRTITIN